MSHLGLQPTKFVTCTVSVVDDDLEAVEVLAAFLPTSEYSVVRAYGGAKAIVLAKRLRPDRRLLDHMMPERNGFDAVEAIQRDMPTASIPTSIVTSKGITADDRTVLAGYSGSVLEILEKAALNRVEFMAGVWRAMQRQEGWS